MAKSPWLQEVEDDANRITRERIKAFNEEQARKKAKADAEAAKVVEAEAVNELEVEVKPVEEPVEELVEEPKLKVKKEGK